MTRFTRGIALALAVALLVLPLPLSAQTTGAYYYWWQVTDERGETFTGENVQCSVFRPQTHAAAILHTSATLTSGGNSPLWSDPNGKLHFYASFNTPVDVNCYYTGGGSAHINRFRISDHKIILPRQQGMKISRFPVNSVSATYQTDSGVVIPAGGLITDVVVQNLSQLSLGTYHLSVGFLGNHVVGTANALVSALPLTASVEWLRPSLTTVTGLSTDGTGSHRGLAMTFVHAANNFYMERPYLVHVATGLSVSYSAQPGTSAGVRAHVYILWRQFHSHADRFNLTN